MLNGLLNQVKNAIFNDPTTPHREGYDPSGLIGTIEGLFGNQQQQLQNQGVRPASQDPYGDPANMGGGFAYADQNTQLPGGVRPASQDPYGDPADQFPGGVRPASQDPYGDPADQR